MMSGQGASYAYKSQGTKPKTHTATMREYIKLVPFR
jgi:hypothetical protein